MPLAVAALPVIIAAFVALILLYGLALLLRSVLQGLANHIPLVGGGLSTVIGAVIDDAITLGLSAASAALHGIIAFVMTPVYWLEAHIQSIIATFDTLIDTVAYIVSTLIPSILAALRSEISAVYSAATSYAHSLTVDAINLLNGDVAGLYRALASVQASLVSYIDTGIADAEHYAQSLAAQETAYIDQVAGTLQTEITTSIGQVEGYVAASFDQAVRFTVTSVAAAESTLAGDIAGVTAWAGQEITALQAYIAATGAAVIAFATEAVGVVEADLGNLKSDCTDNLCSGLSALASLANGLMDQAWIAALLGYAAWAVEDPQGAGHATADVLGPVASGAADAVMAAASAL